ncbi:hypothetical protein [Mycoplasmopsis felifaucium]|uniref:hypothetical protein n=1 Tax=Mycoplasmopsis felifaucium TaxID=35768 RepID=UPI00047F288E|nr:hypothetical protein [Mycoplasmopsis felifaucium]
MIWKIHNLYKTIPLKHQNNLIDWYRQSIKEELIDHKKPSNYHTNDEWNISNEPVAKIIKQQGINLLNNIKDLHFDTFEESYEPIKDIQTKFNWSTDLLKKLNTLKVNTKREARYKLDNFEKQYKYVIRDLTKIAEDPKYEFFGLFNPARLTAYKYLQEIMNFKNNFDSFTILELKDVQNYIDKFESLKDDIKISKGSYPFRLDFSEEYKTYSDLYLKEIYYEDNDFYYKTIDHNNYYNNHNDFSMSMSRIFIFKDYDNFYDIEAAKKAFDNLDILYRTKDILLSIYNEVVELFNKTINDLTQYLETNKQYKDIKEFKIVWKQLESIQKQGNINIGERWSYEEMIGTIEAANTYINKFEELKQKHHPSND